MLKNKCIIIEDESPAVALLETYLKELSNWEIEAVFTNAIDALHYLNNNNVDLIFLDIELPKLNGLNFIKVLENPPLIVITSAYSEHAVDAFELVVFDYLLKPYSFERFIKAMGRIEKVLNSNEPKQKANEATILIKSDRKNIHLKISDILYVESQKEYVDIHCKESVYKTKIGISKMEDLLKSHSFIRSHRSFLVALNAVSSFTSSQLNINATSIPVGRMYKHEVMRVLAK